MARLILDQVRKKKKVSKRELAKRLTMDYSSVFRLLKEDTNPTFSTLVRVAAALEVKVRELIKE